jgi:hypothetical protein
MSEEKAEFQGRKLRIVLESVTVNQGKCISDGCFPFEQSRPVRVCHPTNSPTYCQSFSLRKYSTLSDSKDVVLRILARYDMEFVEELVALS